MTKNINRYKNSCNAILLTSFCLVFQNSYALAQSVEKNPAPIERGKVLQALPTSSLQGSDDTTPLGVAVKKIEIINKRDLAQDASYSGEVDLSAAGSLLQNPTLQAQLSQFIGQDLSQQLISEVRATVTRYFRSIDKPLVAVIIPPQEITKGVLRLDVIPFVLGKKQTENNAWSDDEHLLNSTRARQGEEIDSAQLVDDINWLNLNPYRNASFLFAAGKEAGTADLIIRTNEQKPWTVYTGYSNYGSNSKDPHRFFAGFNVANLPVIDGQFGYRFTGSPDAISRGEIFKLTKKDGYLSHAGSFFKPLAFDNGWRHKINLQANYTQKYSHLNSSFTQENRTVSLYGDYGIVLPSVSSLRSEAYIGVDFKRQHNDVFFTGTKQKSTVLDVFNIILGSRGEFRTPFGLKYTQGNDPQFGEASGKAKFDLRVITSPGNITKFNNNAAFVASSDNENAKANYTYLNGEISHLAPLPYEFTLSNELKAQWAFSSLPSIEKFQLGGSGSVRGYLNGELTGDRGFSISSTLTTPTFEVFGRDNEFDDGLNFFAFFDYGQIKDIGSKAAELASIGAGLNYRVKNNLFATIDYGYALRTGSTTMKNSSRISGVLTVRF